ncbi:hypothetical protein PISL3812_04912 [Talaromyces islandicus]|uniref:Uncharacterized protein n=1 Tax=Talaromyces islandicus TaxID=28573 RepID=A0A0U1LYW2_TALIS|nr:hypothetical protein PISL3812_04912 [Talaromyces islandicus]
MNGKTVAPIVRRFDLEIKRQVKYPNVLVAYRQAKIESTRNDGTTTYVDIKTSRPKDTRTLSSGFPALFKGFTKKSERANSLREKWELEHPPKAPEGKSLTLIK